MLAIVSRVDTLSYTKSPMLFIFIGQGTEARSALWVGRKAQNISWRWICIQEMWAGVQEVKTCSAWTCVYSSVASAAELEQ